MSNLRNYIDKLLAFNPGHIDCIFHKDVAFDDVKAMLDGIKFKSIRETNEARYFGEPFVLPKESQKYDIRKLEATDLEAVDNFIAGYPNEIDCKQMLAPPSVYFKYRVLPTQCALPV